MITDFLSFPLINQLSFSLLPVKWPSSLPCVGTSSQHLPLTTDNYVSPKTLTSTNKTLTMQTLKSKLVNRCSSLGHSGNATKGEDHVPSPAPPLRSLAGVHCLLPLTADFSPSSYKCLLLLLLLFQERNSVDTW